MGEAGGDEDGGLPFFDLDSLTASQWHVFGDTRTYVL